MERLGALPIKINEREIYRYTGYKGNVLPEERVRDMISECLAELKEVAVMQAVYRRDPLVFEDPSHFTLADFPVESALLGKNLEGCSESVLIAATLSSSVDLLLHRYVKLDLTRAVILQACSAAMIEAYLNAFEELLDQELKPKGLIRHPRFSPGFGDFTLGYQKPLLESLNATKLIGITQATDSEMMLPSKSVTAVIGIAPTDN